MERDQLLKHLSVPLQFNGRATLCAHSIAATSTATAAGAATAIAPLSSRAAVVASCTFEPTFGSSAGHAWRLRIEDIG